MFGSSSFCMSHTSARPADARQWSLIAGRAYGLRRLATTANLAKLVVRLSLSVRRNNSNCPNSRPTIQRAWFWSVRQDTDESLNEQTPLEHSGRVEASPLNRGESCMTPELMRARDGLRGRRDPRWEVSPNAPGVLVDVPRRIGATAVRSSGSAHTLHATAEYSVITEYDEVDRRLMDTFPASDAVGRY
jgi:hypothetical protein